jgi:lipoprotein-releasing system permease protein
MSINPLLAGSGLRCLPTHHHVGIRGPVAAILHDYLTARSRSGAVSIIKNFPFEWLVGLRYTRAGRRSGRNSFISFISLISMAGITLGVAALIVVLSIMNGFQKDVRDRMLSVLPHIEILNLSGNQPDWQATARQASENKEVTGAAPYAATQAMLTRNQTVRGVMIRGVLPQQEPKVSDVAQQVRSGRFDDLQAGAFNIVLGGELARGLYAQLGDKVTLIAPQGQVTPAGVLPRMKQFTVAGIFDTGHHEHDASLAFIHIDDALKMFRMEAPSGVRLRIADMQRAPQVASDLSEMMGDGVSIQDWSQQNRTWFGAVQTEKRMMFIILALIIAVAAFNMVSTLVMTVTDKQADIAILRTLGASPRSIMKIFMIQGALIGTLGTAIGVSLGVLTALNIDVIAPFIEQMLGIQFLPKDIYLINTLPSDLRWPDVWSIGMLAIVLGFLATLYPSWSAARVKPAEALRYE